MSKKLAGCAMGAAFVLTSFTALTASAADDPQVITNGASNLCLGVRGVDKHGPGTGVEVYWCNPGNGDRGLDYQWTFEDAGDGYWFFKNRVSGLCLGVRGVDKHEPKTEVEVYHCKPGGNDPGADGQWKIVPEKDGFKRIENRVSGLCLTVRGGAKHSAGTAVEVRACDTKGDEREGHWRFQGP